jgi:hypothetical protein
VKLFYQTLVSKQLSFNKKAAHEAILHKNSLYGQAVSRAKRSLTLSLVIFKALY